jgi:hypothetical protein
VSNLRRLAAYAVILAACAASPTQPPSPTRPVELAPAILVQAGEPGLETLTVIDLPSGASTPIGVPVGGIHLLGPGWAPRFAVAQAGASVAIGSPGRDGEVAWEIIDLGTAAPGVVVGSAVSPDGGRLVAALSAADPRRPYDVVTVDIESRRTSDVRVSAELEGIPIWVDDHRVAIPTIGPGHVRALTIVNVDDGSQISQPTELADMTRSADGSRFATATAIYGPTIFELAEPSAALIAHTGVVDNHGSVALDRGGARLAVVLEDEDGDATAIAIYSEAAGWNEEARFAIPGGAKRAFVTWLR